MMTDPTKKEQLPDWNQKVLSVIRPGKSNATTVKNIMSLVGGTDFAVRKAVADLIIKYKYKIAGSTDKACPGFYLIETEEERQEAISSLLGRINQMNKRVQALQKDELKNYGYTLAESNDTDPVEDVELTIEDIEEFLPY